MYALSPRIRIQAEGVLTFGGTFSGCGILRPTKLILDSIRSVLPS
ncbi:MAG: hypothetical protein ACJ709_02655 [Nitrososphaeraceae archaeon]